MLCESGRVSFFVPRRPFRYGTSTPTATRSSSQFTTPRSTRTLWCVHVRGARLPSRCLRVCDAVHGRRQLRLQTGDVRYKACDDSAYTNVRGLEKETFVKTHPDYPESTDALGRAVSVLSDAAHDTQQEAFMPLQNMNLVPLEAKPQVRDFLQAVEQPCLR